MSVLILDSDAVTVLFRRESPIHLRLLQRLEREPAEDVATTIVCFHEQMQGWLSVLNRARLAPAQLINAYSRLRVALEEYCGMTILPFDIMAQAKLETVRPQARRVATLDLRIAAIALAHNATLLSRNLRDFRRVPGLLVEDWSRGS
jgi:tRNA(fMet)-specific endonuclease VapC